MKLKHHKVSLPEEELLQLLAAFRTKRIAVLGDVGIDRYTQGSVDRISPEAPVPIVFVLNEYLKLGLATNVADNIVALGGSTEVVGVVGKDKDASDLMALMKEKGLPGRLVVDPSRRTILKERIVAETQQMLRVDYESTHPLSVAIQKKVKIAFQKAILEADVLIIEDYAKGLLNESMIQEAIAAAKKKKIPVLVDPHSKTPLKWYEGATLLTPNRKEAEALSRTRIHDEASLIQAGQIILKVTKAQCLIIKLGKDGMAIFRTREGKPLYIPTIAKEVYDVSGAGDTVVAVLALSLACQMKLDEAAFVSNIAAGVEVSKRGTATVSPQEIIRAYLTSQ
jgi:D-beta-D-heptose 7-phosphate kinase/D-beta-D-heptose 1-phosphate adenosyltransferase